MAKNTGAVCKLCRREDEKLFLKGMRCYTDKCALERRPYPPGQHGQRRAKVSDYGIQLREKQKLKRLYGVQEKQMRKTFKTAISQHGVTGEVLLSLLERRLDNVVYRMGLAASRKESRQLVKHGHFLINDRKAMIPSMRVKKGDVISLRDKSKACAKITSALETYAIREVPAWLDLDKTNYKATVRDLPKREDITAKVEERLVVELYNK